MWPQQQQSSNVVLYVRIDKSNIVTKKGQFVMNGGVWWKRKCAGSFVCMSVAVYFCAEHLSHDQFTYRIQLNLHETPAKYNRTKFYYQNVMISKEEKRINKSVKRLAYKEQKNREKSLEWVNWNWS